MKSISALSSLAVFGLLASLSNSHASDDWKANPVDNDWLNASNWNAGGGTNTILEGDNGDSTTNLSGDAGSLNGAVKAGLQIRGGHILNILSGASLNVSGNINMGAAGSGTVYQTGGSVDVDDSLFMVGSHSASYTISGGSLTTDGISVGTLAASTFAIEGDTASVEVAGALNANAFSTFGFTLGMTGVDTIDSITTMTIVSGAGLVIDGSSYTGGAGTISLFSYSDLADATEFAESISGFGSLTADVVYTATGIDLVLIPEPGTYALLGGMLALTAVIMRRR